MAAKHLTEMHTHLIMERAYLPLSLSRVSLPLSFGLSAESVCLFTCLSSTQSVCAESWVFHDRSGMTLSDLSVDTTMCLYTYLISQLMVSK